MGGRLAWDWGAADEEAGEIEVAFFASLTVKLDEGQFDLRVPVGGPVLTGAEDAVEVVGEAAGDLQQRVISGRAVVGHRPLHQVSGTVHLVGVLEEGVALAGAFFDEVGAQVAVGLLGGGDVGDDGRGGLAQLRPVLGLEHITDGLNPLVQVRVGVQRPLAPDTLPRQAPEVVQVPVLFHEPVQARDASLDVAGAQWRPESLIGKPHGRQRDGAQARAGAVAGVQDRMAHGGPPHASAIE